MAQQDFPNISGVSPSETVKPIQPESERGSGSSFSSYMQGGASAPSEAAAPSPMQIAGVNGLGIAQPSNATILAQMNSASGLIGDMQSQLNTKNLRLKPSQKYLLRNKLTESNNLIRSAAERMGVDTGEKPEGLSRQSPVVRFLSLLADSQTQLSSAQQKLKEMSDSGKTMSPGELLLVQVKVNKAQQELEFSSVLLSNAVNDIKTIFNIQI